MCENKHVWNTPLAKIRKGHWCPKCACENRKLKDGLEQAHLAAKLHGGRCLSTKYTKNRIKWNWFHLKSPTLSYGVGKN